MTPGKEGKTEMRKHNTHESKNNWNKNFLIARSAIYGEMCTNTLTSLLLHPSTWKNHTDDYLWGDFDTTKNSFPSFSFSSCSTSSTWAFNLENAFPHGTYGQRGAEGRFSRCAASTVPTWGTGEGRPASNLTFNSSTTLPICLGYNISRCNSTTRFPYPTSQILEILPP